MPPRNNDGWDIYIYACIYNMCVYAISHRWENEAGLSENMVPQDLLVDDHLPEKKNNGWGRHPFSDSSITRCHQVFLQPSQLPCAVAQAEAGLQPLQRPQWPWPEFVEIIG